MPGTRSEYEIRGGVAVLTLLQVFGCQEDIFRGHPKTNRHPSDSKPPSRHRELKSLRYGICGEALSMASAG